MTNPGGMKGSHRMLIQHVSDCKHKPGRLDDYSE